MSRFILTLQFLTRITLAKDIPYDKNFGKGIVYFPFVGLVLGIILAGAYKGLSFLFPTVITSIIIIVLYVGLTGGLHLDGLGDTFDGFYSSRTRDRILEIMKDSRLGTHWVIVILFNLLLKIFGLATIAQETGIIALIILPIVGRLALVYGSFQSRYAREEGLGHIFIGKVTVKEVIVTTIIASILMTIHWPSLVFIPILWIFASLFKNHCKRVINGMTGDTLGALCELAEALYLLYLLGIGNLMM